MLEQEFKYYLDHQDELAKKHYSRYIIIKGETVLGDYSNEIEAILAAKGEFDLELGSFLVQQCSPGVENYTQYFNGGAMFTRIL